MNDIIIAREKQILRVQFNRPQKKNALTPPMYDALREAIESADADDDIRVICTDHRQRRQFHRRQRSQQLPG